MKKILKKNVNNAAESMPKNRQRLGRGRITISTKRGRNISPGLHTAILYRFSP